MQIQHTLINLKKDLLIKIANDFKLKTNFAKKNQFRCATGSEFASDYNQCNISYKQQNGYIMVFRTKTNLLGFCLFQANNRNITNTRARCETCVKLTTMTPEQHQ